MQSTKETQSSLELVSSLPIQPRAPIGNLLCEVARERYDSNKRFTLAALAFIDADPRFWSHCYRILHTYANTGCHSTPRPFLTALSYSYNHVSPPLVRVALTMHTQMGDGDFIDIDRFACTDNERTLCNGTMIWCSHDNDEHKWAAVLSALLTNTAFRADFCKHTAEHECLRFSVHTIDSNGNSKQQQRSPWRTEYVSFDVEW